MPVFTLTVLSYLLDVLALELGDELIETIAVGLNANGFKDFLDIRCGWRGVAGEVEEEVCCQVLHLESC